MNLLLVLLAFLNGYWAGFLLGILLCGWFIVNGSKRAHAKSVKFTQVEDFAYLCIVVVLMIVLFIVMVKDFGHA